MKSFFLLLLGICCFHVCFAGEGPVDLQMEGDCVNGQGTRTFYNGSKYVGQFIDGELNGQGNLNFPDGSRYAGEFRNGQINGQGTMTYSDGTVYVGEFKDGALCGHGTISFPDGSIYEGQFKDDNYHGKGIWSSPFGIRYEGQFKDGKFDGQGIYSLPDGSRYIGYFKNDKFHGQGEWVVDDTADGKSGSTDLEREKMAYAEEAYFSDVSAMPLAETAKSEDAIELQRQTGHATSELAFSVQVGAFLTRENAEKLANLLRERGYKAHLLLLNDYANRPWFTVRLGSYTSLEEAQENAAAFSIKEKITATVRPVDSL